MKWETLAKCHSDRFWTATHVSPCCVAGGKNDRHPYERKAQCQGAGRERTDAWTTSPDQAGNAGGTWRRKQASWSGKPCYSCNGAQLNPIGHPECTEITTRHFIHRANITLPQLAEILKTTQSRYAAKWAETRRKYCNADFHTRSMWDRDQCNKFKIIPDNWGWPDTRQLCDSPVNFVTGPLISWLTH